MGRAPRKRPRIVIYGREREFHRRQERGARPTDARYLIRSALLNCTLLNHLASLLSFDAPGHISCAQEFTKEDFGYVDADEEHLDEASVTVCLSNSHLIRQLAFPNGKRCTSIELAELRAGSRLRADATNRAKVVNQEGGQL